MECDLTHPKVDNQGGAKAVVIGCGRFHFIMNADPRQPWRGSEWEEESDVPRRRRWRTYCVRAVNLPSLDRAEVWMYSALWPMAVRNVTGIEINPDHCQYGDARSLCRLFLSSLPAGRGNMNVTDGRSFIRNSHAQLTSSR